jgi:hypothetical protein
LVTSGDVTAADWLNSLARVGEPHRSAQHHCRCGLRGQPEPRLQGLAMDAASVQIQSPRLEIQELAALIGGELFLFEQQKFMLFFCLSFRFEQMPESRPLGRSSSVTSCS